MSLFQTIIIAIVQGITELFPVSSVAHSVLTPYIFHWNLDPQFLKVNFLPFMVMLHLGTALALFTYFGREWIEIVKAVFDSRQKNARRLLTLIIIGSIPAGLIGVILEKPLTNIFSNVTSAAVFLIVNGCLLFFGEKMRKHGTREIKRLNYRQAFVIGLFQALALVPGFSRSGASMTAGFMAGLKHEEAARFSMLLATPIILGASLLELPKLFKSGVHGLLEMSLAGGLLAGIFAYISVWILMRWFKKNEISAMRPFAYYCWIVGGIILLTRIL
jgi:undecaprenyl-diphosphatase